MDNVQQNQIVMIQPAGANSAPLPDNQSRVIGADLAHELNNIFTIICGFTDRMIYEHGQDVTIRPDLQVISDSVRRAERVVRQATRVSSKPTITVA